VNSKRLGFAAAILAATLYCATLSWLADGSLHAQAPVIGQGGGAPGPALITRGGHIFVGGPAIPQSNVTNCGTTPSAFGSDIAGVVIVGAGATACTIAFSVPWPQLPNGNFIVPFCVAVGQAGPITYSVDKGPPAVFNILTVTAPNQVQWQCIGNYPP
jgi:hypothetical protein